MKTNLLIFTEGRSSERVWYYDLSDVKVGEKTPLPPAQFEDFFTMLPARPDGPLRWSLSRAEIVARNYDLKASNPNVVSTQDTRTPTQLLEVIEVKGHEVDAALAALRHLVGAPGH